MAIIAAGLGTFALGSASPASASCVSFSGIGNIAQCDSSLGNPPLDPVALGGNTVFNLGTNNFGYVGGFDNKTNFSTAVNVGNLNYSEVQGNNANANATGTGNKSTTRGNNSMAGAFGTTFVAADHE